MAEPAWVASGADAESIRNIIGIAPIAAQKQHHSIKIDFERANLPFGWFQDEQTLHPAGIFKLFRGSGLQY